jgi:hypothetical protein
MGLFEISVWITAIIMMAGSFYYCFEIKKGIVSPPPATFIIAAVTFTLSLFMYSRNPNWSFTANIGLTSAFLSAWTICIYLSAKLLREGKFFLSINNWQKFALCSALVVFIIWVITNNAFVSYLLLQIAALIAYTPVIQKLWNAKKNSESLIFWTSLFLSSLVASYAAYQRNDTEAWIYIFRAVPSTLLVVFLTLKARSN